MSEEKVGDMMNTDALVTVSTAPTPKYERHTFLPGERVHYRTEVEISAGLTDGYLELEMLFEGPNNTSRLRVIRKGTLNGYYQTEAEIGKSEGAITRFFDTLEELMQKIDLHVYKWYPLWGDSRFHYPDQGNSLVPMNDPIAPALIAK